MTELDLLALMQEQIRDTHLYTAQSGHKKIVALLVENGADLLTTEGDNETPLRKAI